MELITDLHLHSKYSRAVSRDINLFNMALWADKKGLDIVSASDWTHPLWFKEITKQLKEEEKGIFKLKDQKFNASFILSVEISSIYSHKGKVHRIHNLIFSPSFETAEKISKELLKKGCNLSSDGRPTIGLSSIALSELIFSIDKEAMIVPCHIWTPWFSLYGSNSGFDSIDECFGEFADQIFAVETGLSSDPSMNWQIKELDKRSIISSSDAHSLIKMGREATVFKTIKNKVSYNDIKSALERKSSETKVFYTIEFYPEEGKYHYTGHRNCGFVQDPKQTKKDGNICPVCKKQLTIGVMHRVEELSEDEIPNGSFKRNPNGIKWMVDQSKKRPPFVKLVPLVEIIAESLSSTVSSQKVLIAYNNLCKSLGSELNVLLKANIAEIEKVSGGKIAEGIDKVRKGEIVILPGFDGQYGVVKIWDDKKISEKQSKVSSQLGIDF